MENLIGLISIDSDIHFGKPCIKGTRISVQDVLKWLSSGMSNEEIIEDFPQLTQEHIRVSFSFCSR